MPRSFARLKAEVWETGSEFRELSLPAQGLYVMLISQAGVSMVGTLTYAPKKWARFARGLSVEEVEELIAELEERCYLLVDVEADELLIRSFVKHDACWRLPNLLVSARVAFRAVESPGIRAYLAGRHPWLADDRSGAEVERYEFTRVATDVRTDVATAMATGVATAVATDVATGGRLARTRADADSEADTDPGIRVVVSASDTPRAQSAPLEAPQARADESQDDQDQDRADGALAVRAECPVCGPLHVVPLGFDLEAHVRDVHGLELADVLASRSGEA